MLLILVDVGEPPEVMRALVQNAIEFERKELRINDERVGDFTSDTSSFIVERKKAPDLVASIFDGRLARQVDLMKKYYESNRFLIVEGDIFVEAEKHFKARNLILSSIPALAVGGVNVLMTKSANETVQYVYWIHHACNKQNSSALRCNINSLPKSGNDKLDGLLVIPGIGEKRAAKILEEARDVTLADLATGRYVPSFLGEKTREAIYKHFNTPILGDDDGMDRTKRTVREDS